MNRVNLTRLRHTRLERMADSWGELGSSAYKIDDRRPMRLCRRLLDERMAGACKINETTRRKTNDAQRRTGTINGRQRRQNENGDGLSWASRGIACGLRQSTTEKDGWRTTDEEATNNQVAAHRCHLCSSSLNFINSYGSHSLSIDRQCLPGLVVCVSQSSCALCFYVEETRAEPPLLF